MSAMQPHPNACRWAVFFATACVALLGAVLTVASGGSLVQPIDRLAGDAAPARATACVAAALPWPSSSGCAMVGKFDLHLPEGGT